MVIWFTLAFNCIEKFVLRQLMGIKRQPLWYCNASTVSALNASIVFIDSFEGRSCDIGTLLELTLAIFFHVARWSSLLPPRQTVEIDCLLSDVTHRVCNC